MKTPAQRREDLRFSPNAREEAERIVNEKNISGEPGTFTDAAFIVARAYLALLSPQREAENLLRDVLRHSLIALREPDIRQSSIMIIRDSVRDYFRSLSTSS